MYQFVDTPSTRNFVSVSDQYCQEYVDLYWEIVETDAVTSVSLEMGEYYNTPEACAAAARAADGIRSCRAEYFFWSFEGRCYCPREDDCSSSNENWNAGEGQLYKFTDGFVSSIADCSQDWCTSPDGGGGHDCWAGSESEECGCSQGSARETGASYPEHDVVEYTCCMSGDNVGEECGDCCVDYESILIAIIGGVVGGVVVLICCAIAICYVAKCACFAKNVAPVAAAPLVATIEMATPMQPMVALQPQNAKSNSITLQAQPQAAVVLQPQNVTQPQVLQPQTVTQPQVLTPQVLQPQTVTQPQVLQPQTVTQPQVLQPTQVQSL
jgi:hypothetical protein